MRIFILAFGTSCSFIDGEKHSRLIEDIENASLPETQDPEESETQEPSSDTADSTEPSADSGAHPPETDSDGDGLSDTQEQDLGTDPLLFDTDNDGLPDGDEVNIHETDPLCEDTDQDRLTDGDEVNTYLTNPILQDSDYGGVPDGVEVLIDFSNPKEATDDLIRDEEGMFGGHVDVATTASISSVENGHTDEHVHQFDDKYDVVSIDAFDLHDSGLHTIQQDIANEQRKFKIILANPDLNKGARISINQQYDAPDKTSWISAQEYAEIALTDLPVYTLSEIQGAVQLTHLTISFDEYAILFDEIHGTKTDCVRSNVLGPNGEWRNGSLVLQAVMINEDGSDAFQNNTGQSAGGLHGVAQSGLLWEMTVFWNWTEECF